jgi:prophage antirepressor-like protein
MLEKLFWNGEDELKDLTTELVVRSAGWSTRVFNEEGIYLISMLAKTPKAKEFRKKVAMLLKELRQHRIAIASKRAISDYRSLLKKIERMGRSNKFIHNLVRYKKMGLTNQEIAKLLSVSIGTVRNYEMIIKKAGLMEVL